MKHFLFITTFCFLLTCSYRSNAQVYAAARLLTTVDGLSDNRVNCIYKDKTGFVWIGTRNGLNQYDGHSFRVFKPSSGNSISNEIIHSITEDKNGNVWVGTMDGLNKYNVATNHWETIMPLTNKTKPGLPNNLVWDIQFDQTGLLWIASDVFEFSSFNTTTGVFTHYDWPGFAKTLPAIAASRYTSIQKFTAKSAHEYWLATNRGLVHLNINTRTFKLIGQGYKGTVKSLWYDVSAGKVYITLDTGECFAYDETTEKRDRVDPLPDPYPSTQLSVARNNQHWMAAATGVLTITAGAQGLRLSGHIAGFSGSLLPDAINAVYTDNNGIHWVGTDNGLALYDPQPMTSFIPLLPLSVKPAGNTMGGVYFDALSNSYFVCALDPATVFVVPANGNAITKMTTDVHGERFSGCNTITEDSDGTIWLLTDRHCYRYDTLRKSFRRFAMPNRGTDAGFRAFAQDTAGNYWFGTYLQGIYLYNKKKQQFDSTHFPFLPFTKKIGSLRLDTKRNSIWISAYSSDVIRYELGTGSMEGFEDRPGLSALNLVSDILIDRHGNTWMATSGSGIFKMPAGKPAGTSVSHFNMKTGLPENTFAAMAEDQSGHIWLLSETGLSAIDSAGNLLKARQPSSSTGITNFTSDTRSPHHIVFNPSRKEIAAAAGGGLYLVSTAIPQLTYSLTLVITSVKTGNRDSMTEHTSIDSVQALPYRNNALRVEFAGLYYGSSAEVTYEYQLTGYDNQWHPTTTYTAFYQNLPAGSYRFAVRASYRGKALTRLVYPVSFVIVPPFWVQSWFVSLLLLLTATAVALLVYSLLQKLKAEKLLNAFATSLYGKNNLEDICRDVARNCIGKLGLSGCIIYQYDEERQLLVLQAAADARQTVPHHGYHSSIPFSKQAATQIAAAGEMNTTPDSYHQPFSQPTSLSALPGITLPMITDGKLRGVMDAIPPGTKYVGFYRKLLSRVATLCAERMARYQGEERLRGKIARDLHDEMGSTLTSINIMSTVAMQDGAQMKVNDYLQKIKDNSARILESIGDMVWVINPANDNFETLLFRMKEFAAEMLEPAGIQYHFRENGRLNGVQLHLAQRKELYMIFKEAITNAVKYSNATDISVHLHTDNNILQMEISDNGRGFDVHATTKGNGLRNMKNRAEGIDASITILAEKDRGTSIRLHLPLTLSGYDNNGV